MVLDAWENVATGLGGYSDRSQGTCYQPPPELGPEDLTDLYRTNWLARRAVEALPARALARGFADDAGMPEGWRELNYAIYPEGALQRAAYLGNLYGGALLFAGFTGAGSGKLETPAPESGQIAFFEVFTRHELRPIDASRESDPEKATFGQPTIWEVQGTHIRRGLRFHASRAIRFDGLSRPPELSVGSSTTASSSQWDRDLGESVLLPIWDDIKRYGVFWQSVEHLIQEASVGTLKVSGLMQMLAQKRDAVVRARVRLANMARSLFRTLLLDADKNESFERQAVTFADIPKLLEVLELAVSGSLRTPVTELFGRAPAGMNATGESDARMWESQVQQYQEIVLAPKCNRIAAWMGGRDIKFPPVRMPTAKEEEELRAMRAKTDHLIWTAEAVTSEEIRIAQRRALPVGEVLTSDEIPEAEEEEETPPPGRDPDEQAAAEQAEAEDKPDGEGTEE